MTELSNTGTLSVARAVDNALVNVIQSVAIQERGRHFRSCECAQRSG